MPDVPPRPVLERLEDLFDRSRTRSARSPFDPAASPLHGRVIFVVGAPRSGTTWLHQMMATHPDVATSGESHVFCEGVGEVLDNEATPEEYARLCTWIPRAELVALVRAMVDGIFEAQRATQRPGATRVLDKTPSHRAFAAHLAEVYPDAVYIHLIRDGRDSAASAKARFGSWDERSRHLARAAANWRMAVLDNREHLASLDYHEFKYEDLLADPAAGFAAVLDAARLPWDEAFVDEVTTFASRPVNMTAGDTRIGPRKWAGNDDRGERAATRLVGDLLVELGYLSDAERRAVLSQADWRDGAVAGAARQAVAAVRRMAAAAIERTGSLEAK